jgi:multiple sugar transport system substrate-binding protein
MLPKDDFSAEVLKGCTYGGHALAIPQDAYCPVLWLNLDLFEKAGVAYDPDRAPLTRGEFMELCTILTVDKNGKHPNESDFDPKNVAQWAYGTNDMVGITHMQNGIDSVSLDGSCKATVTEAKYIDGLQWGQDIVHKYHYKSGEHWSADEQSLAAGKLAINGNGSWFYDWFRLHPEVPNKAVWPWPQIGEKKGTWVDSHGLCLPADAKPEKVEWGQKMIKFISDSHIWAAEAGMPTPRKSVAQHPLIASNWALPTEIKQQEWKLPPNLSYPCPTEVGGILNPAIAAVLNNEKQPLDAMVEAEPRIQQVLDRCCKK